MLEPIRLLALGASASLFVAFAGAARAQPTDPEAAAIERTALDYIESWYEGNPERTARAVHPELEKRIVTTENGVSWIDRMGATRLIHNVRGGHGKKTPPARQRKEVTILDRYQNVASVKVVASDWIDYLHVAKIDGRWQIVNVLWERHPTAPAPPAAKSPPKR